MINLILFSVVNFNLDSLVVNFEIAQNHKLLLRFLYYGQLANQLSS